MQCFMMKHITLRSIPFFMITKLLVQIVLFLFIEASINLRIVVFNLKMFVTSNIVYVAISFPRVCFQKPKMSTSRLFKFSSMPLIFQISSFF